MNRRFLHVSLLTLVISSPLFGVTEYFVSTRGSDTNPGTKAQPFATLTRARDVVREFKSQRGLVKEGVKRVIATKPPYHGYGDNDVA